MHGMLSTAQASSRRMQVDTSEPSGEQLAVLREFGFTGPDQNVFRSEVLESKPDSLSGKQDTRQPNIVLVLLESWNAAFVDSFSGKSLGLTPEFDALAERGQKFTNFFANGTRSIEAIQALLTGFPALQGMPVFGQGFELLQIPRIGEILRRAGYGTTVFAQSSRRRSFSLDSVARALGFTEYYGQEDFPDILDYKGQPRPDFGWDYETLIGFAEKLNAASAAPFFGMVFTGTTHVPYRFNRPCSGSGTAYD